MEGTTEVTKQKAKEKGSELEGTPVHPRPGAPERYFTHGTECDDGWSFVRPMLSLLGFFRGDFPLIFGLHERISLETIALTDVSSVESNHISGPLRI